MGYKMAPNQSVQRTGASRFAQRRIQRHRRLSPVADLYVRRQNILQFNITNKMKHMKILTLATVTLIAYLPVVIRIRFLVVMLMGALVVIPIV